MRSSGICENVCLLLTYMQVTHVATAQKAFLMIEFSISRKVEIAMELNFGMLVVCFRQCGVALEQGGKKPTVVPELNVLHAKNLPKL